MHAVIHSSVSGDSNGWVMPLVCGVMSAVFFFRLWRNFRCARAIEDTPTSKVATAPQGQVELFGQARAVEGSNILCPLTATPCLWYSFKVERYEHHGKSSSWVTVSSGRSRAPFLLDDGTGQTFVHPDQADVSPQNRRQWRGGSAIPTPPYGTTGFLSLGSYRYTEEFILPGDNVYVLGWFETTQTGLTSGEALQEKLRTLKKDHAALLARFDQNGDGELSLEEWDAAREIVAAELRETVLKTSPTQAVNMVSMPRESDVPYLISTVGQAALAGRYRRRAAFCLAGFLGLGALAVSLTMNFINKG